MTLVDHFNTQATSANYRYVRKVKLGSDLTPRPLLPVDRVLLDADVVGLVLAAYEGTPLEEIATFDSIMSTFWTDIAHGKNVIAESIAPPEENGAASSNHDQEGDGNGNEEDDEGNDLVDSESGDEN